MTKFLDQVTAKMTTARFDREMASLTLIRGINHIYLNKLIQLLIFLIKINVSGPFYKYILE